MGLILVSTEPIFLLVGTFNPFQEIISMYVPIRIFLIVLVCSYRSFPPLVFPTQRSFFSFCWKAGLVVLNSLSFCLSVKLLISPLNINEIFAG